MKPRHQKNCQQNQNPSVSSLSELWAKISPNSAKIENLLPDQRANLLHSLKSLDLAQIDLMRFGSSEKKHEEPLTIVSDALEPSEYLIRSGESELLKGKVGVLILAGGQGSRLGNTLPKGMFPLSPIRGKSLFQIFAEKLKLSQRKYCKTPPLAIMTSRKNRRQIETFFSKHKYWGLDPTNIHFFTQNELPLFDHTNDPLIDCNGCIRTAPNGNGGAFEALLKTGTLKKIGDRGVQHLMVIPIDNPFADPVNAALVGANAYFCHNQGKPVNCVYFKGVERRQLTEKTGVFVLNKGQLRIIDYTECNEKRHMFENSQTSGLANTGEFCISIQFANSLGKIPLTKWFSHSVKKDILNQSSTGERKSSVRKTEYFITDLLIWAKNAQVIKFDRDLTFNPLKEASGPQSPRSLQSVMKNCGQEIYL